MEVKPLSISIKLYPQDDHMSAAIVKEIPFKFFLVY